MIVAQDNGDRFVQLPEGAFIGNSKFTTSSLFSGLI